MSNNLTETLLLVGAGKMAIEYAKVLQKLIIPFIVIGRGEESARNFTKITGVTPLLGGVAACLSTQQILARTAIVAVNVQELAPTVSLLLDHGVKRILVEKPAGLTAAQINDLAQKTKEQDAEVYVAYNRRFYASTKKALELIAKDGGVTSFNFEFTEWSSVIESNKNISDDVKENWFLANSSHVVDLAFFLGGKPKELQCYKAGQLTWHSAAAVFAGAGRSEKGALFSYQANWQAPGRWRVEVLTRRRRIILCPLEELYVQNLHSLEVVQVSLEDSFDKAFKPGFYEQTIAFLAVDKIASGLLPIGELADLASRIYAKISKNT